MKKVTSVVAKSFTALFLVLALCGTIAVACSNPQPKPERPEKPGKPEKPEKPAKIITKPCPPLRPLLGGKNRKERYPLSNPCYALYNLNQITDEGNEEGIEEVLPQLLSSELSQNFSVEEFTQAIAETEEVFGEIVSFNFPDEVLIQDDWAEAILELTTSNGQQLNFLVIFHQEGNPWKIFATEEI